MRKTLARLIPWGNLLFGLLCLAGAVAGLMAPSNVALVDVPGARYVELACGGGSLTLTTLEVHPTPRPDAFLSRVAGILPFIRQETQAAIASVTPHLIAPGQPTSYTSHGAARAAEANFLTVTRVRCPLWIAGGCLIVLAAVLFARRRFLNSIGAGLHSNEDV